MTVVLDASALVELVTDSRLAEAVRTRIRSEDQAAPHLIDAEVLAVVQKRTRMGELDQTAGRLAIADLEAWPGERLPHRPLLERCWELRENVRGYDALYVALAEALDAPLLTCDSRLERAPGPRCAFEVLS